MEQEIVLGVELGDVGLGADEYQLRKTRRQHLLHAVVDIAGPERDHSLREIFLEQGQHARRVGDVADIHRLPGGTQDHARGVLTFGGAERGSEGGHEGRFQETTAGKHGSMGQGQG